MCTIMGEIVTVIRKMWKNRWRLGLAEGEKSSLIKTFGLHPGLGEATRHQYSREANKSLNRNT
jgi:hypothetical protein